MSIRASRPGNVVPLFEMAAIRRERMDEPQIRLPDSLRAARQLYKKSGVEVAEALEMSPAAYRRYERGETMPSAAVILQLAELYGCSPNAVLCTGGVEPSKEAGAAKHSVELNLEAGDTFTIIINATAAEKAEEEDFPQPTATVNKSA